MDDRPGLARAFEAAVQMAVRAPSVHNSQPWRWRLEGKNIHLDADPTRHLPVTDPTTRALLMSCGAALHHMRVALAALGWQTRVDRLPDPEDPNRLATLEARPGQAAQSDIDLAAAIPHRQSDRRRYDSRGVSGAHLRQVSAVAPKIGAAARQVPGLLRGALAQAASACAQRHARDPRYQRELHVWSGRHRSADGVPAANTPPTRVDDEIVLRTFDNPELADTQTDSDGAEWLVICTPADDRLACLKAGEATSAVLLTATGLGLASCVQTEPLSMPDLAAALRTEVLHDCAFPQAMVRIGWTPATAAPLPITPRRPTADIIDDPQCTGSRSIPHR
ncbi:hypothetical protein D7D52_18165 [Nocardia yunnanensis]|uniref:NAD(P)H nitroreductase n=1 Tax=Nocardia yunnanensis TaxID=2382165 RepID=A0A386ZCR5_9NOCA|nr:hypothetical protein [Nocardia yunnanensis]AYF75461.1 hypothetical protein D7D52_18165 [Nocardia yunnanensis]